MEVSKISTTAAGRAHSAHRGLMLNRVRPPSILIKRFQKLMLAIYPTTDKSPRIALEIPSHSPTVVKATVDISGTHGVGPVLSCLLPVAFCG